MSGINLRIKREGGNIVARGSAGDRKFVIQISAYEVPGISELAETVRAKLPQEHRHRAYDIAHSIRVHANGLLR